MMKLQIPTSKLQRNFKHQASKRAARRNLEKVVFSISLGLGIWNLVFLWSLEFGAWNL
jgi:hypothetical protein